MSLPEAFSAIPDPRRSQGLRTSLEQLLTMAVLSYMAGCTGFRGIKRFCNANKELLTEELSLKHSIPSHVTFSTVLAKLESSSLIAAFHAWSAGLGLAVGEWVSADGKVLGSTVSDCHGNAQDFEATVSLFCQQSGLTQRIGNYKNKSKACGEQEVARLLINELKGMGVVLCLDALHTQKKQQTGLLSPVTTM